MARRRAAALLLVCAVGAFIVSASEAQQLTVQSSPGTVVSSGRVAAASLSLSLASAGIPVCAPGAQTCGTNGCFMPAFSTCINNQCYARILGVVFENPIACLPYTNACGWNTYCNSGFTCIDGTCVPNSSISSASNYGGAFSSSGMAPTPTVMAASTPGAPAVSPKTVAAALGAAALEALLGGKAAARLTPLQACAAARAQQQGCSSDTSALVRSDAAKLGYAAVTSGTECFESLAFKCCASAGADATTNAIVNSCKGSVILENAVVGLVNGTAALLHQLSVAANNRSSVGATGAAGSGAFTAADGAHPTAASVLQPVFQGLANVVTNVTHALLVPLNKTIANATASAQAKAKALSGSAAMAPSATVPYSTFSSGSPQWSVPMALVGGLLLMMTLAV